MLCSRVKLSVVVCTRNRAASLARTLDSLARTEPPRRADWQVVVIDNGSSDDTPQVIERFRVRLPLHASFEPRPGIAHARNAGVAASDGDYLVWTDDDVTVSGGWLRSYESAIEAHPRVAFFGGPVRVRFVEEPPRWLRKGLPIVATAFAGIDVRAPVGPVDARSWRLPVTANMAVGAAHHRAHAFDPQLGRQPWRHGILSGEETDVLLRIAEAGGTGVWLADPEVFHWIGRERQTRDYLRSYYVGIGYVGARSAIAKGRVPGSSTRRRLTRRAAGQRAAYLIGRMCGRTSLWLAALRREAQLRGRLLAHREAAAARAGVGVAR
jgi:glycosyltransferase involved in cell wall biosynthesis